MNRILTETDNLRPAGPYSLARKEGELLFMSGQIGLDKNLQLVEGGVVAEFKQIAAHTKEVLESYGLGMGAVISVRLYLKDINDFTKINPVYSQVFQEPYPVRATIGVADLPLAANIELEVVATFNNSIGSNL